MARRRYVVDGGVFHILLGQQSGVLAGYACRSRPARHEVGIAFVHPMGSASAYMKSMRALMHQRAGEAFEIDLRIALPHEN
jgi:hypothetical protein